MDRSPIEKRPVASTAWEQAGWDAESPVFEILREGDTLTDVREDLYAYLCDLEWETRSGDRERGRLSDAASLRAIGVLKNIISPENERLCGFSSLRLLRDVALERDAAARLAPGFHAEMRQLLRAIHGDTETAAGWMGSRLATGQTTLGIDFAWPAGRGAARSARLDRMADAAMREVARFPSGLDPTLWRARQRNRRRILAAFGATDDDWASPDWQREHALTEADGLALLQRLAALSDETREALFLAVAKGIPWGITPYYLSLFDLDTADRRRDAQLRAQVLPPLHTVEAMAAHIADRRAAFDFMGEADTSPIERVTRRYPLVAILKLTDRCPQICVYCQRNWEIVAPRASEGLAGKAIDAAIAWFARHPSIVDILVTGGDPLNLPFARIADALERLASLPHVAHLRIGTRIPVTMPMGVSQQVAALLGGLVRPGRRQVSVVTHVESGLEVTPEFVAAVGRLRRQGLTVYNQQVFTLETSRRFQSVATRIALKSAGVDPYYTFYAKGKEEHHHYLVPIARILQERREEARLLPGVFRTDEPVFNVPRLGKTHLRADGDRELIGICADGRRVYLFHPWEKGIAPTRPWVYVDVSILDYLGRLSALGEDVADYASIWSYY